MSKKIIAPVTKNEELTVSISDLTYQGLGVAKVDNFPIFIEDALPTEEVKIKIIKVKKNFAFGKLIKVLKKSADRVEIQDKRYTQSGIAPLQHLSYPKQLEFKQHQIAELFKKAHLDVQVDPTIGMENPSEYRNKAQIPVREIKGQLETGFYRRHSHDLIPIEDFYIQDPQIDKAILVVRDILRKYQIPAYNELTHQGLIRNVMVRYGKFSHEMMIVLVMNGKQLPHAAEIVADIEKALPNLDSLVLNINTSKGNRLLGEKNVMLAGKEYIMDELLNTKFMISPLSFYQVNPEQTEKLYSLAIEKASLTKNDIVIDAYCGIGTISLAMAPEVKHVYGVDVVKEAIEDARTNAKLNHIENATFVVGKAEGQMKKWETDGIKANVIVVDPPRKGLDASFIESAIQMSPERLVYVSCNPATLVRDAELLIAGGYKIKQPIQPVDQFPQTPHVESVTVFSRD
ncbi:23S rRNA (uracil-5-)-methyltransferase RumA [Fructilactobacillus lindneri]|uniref:RNA methyltransferase n=2 Tax=Fructilactobacillus lindneri TaxID=53444 RepID=A0A0R2JN01_9LACO|nr:23S rRNA (uracil(1939)-C(5))-methyltransferase RlmD [Fructilactobacillus lindneri]ANZ57966.1 23S rRNA (uracil-5-)-methyltransferase RumA [Fructilactobacillus lindneri]ANZ59236.1 23S rRNA (uracil-5-)-methyltransferase RumA [Fructilactobacillus lindneri]KRN78559.1 RNA methyltransferase [Fructilactobacillus lindneri DSM 20690 = JCM 11027]POG98287.1 23S rRNA (uracil-5-)-methyltransferase RumA [Fructilactobacillus lindneri]POH01596.1 23S rRNA (uracil-5-)-methyltransferase RumA [Fructilactobacill